MKKITPFLFTAALLLVALSQLDRRFQIPAGLLVLAWIARVAVMPHVPGLFCTDPTGTKSDGGIVFGSQLVTINGIAYAASNITLGVFDSNWIVRKNEHGVDDAQAGAKVVSTGSAVLQLSTAAIALPPDFSAFSLVDHVGTVHNVILSKVGIPMEQFGETKVSIDFRNKLAA